MKHHGEGSDLTVGLIPGSLWVSGSLATSSGIEYMPNLPTEEVFTSPDRHRADGTLRLTRPLVMPRAGVLVEGLVVRFENGRIVDATADVGLDAILAELDSDEGARSLGEVSLVDRTSRINQAGVVFHDTLYDENAGCHVAWGQSFPFCVEGGLAMSGDELFALGLNTSAVHTDVVVAAQGSMSMASPGTGVRCRSSTTTSGCCRSQPSPDRPSGAPRNPAYPCPCLVLTLIVGVGNGQPWPQTGGKS